MDNMKEKILEKFDEVGTLGDKVTFEQFVHIAIEDDLSMSDVYSLYEEYYDFAKSIWDLVHEDKEANNV